MPPSAQIQAAIAQLQQQGQTPSVRTVRALTGGSFRDISQALRTWRGTQGLEQVPLGTPGCAGLQLCSPSGAQGLEQVPLGTPDTGAAPDTPQVKRYTCARFPRLAIGRRIRFTQGQYVTSDPDEQALIEANDWFGGLIQRRPA
jgi:hypothetical protein